MYMCYRMTIYEQHQGYGPQCMQMSQDFHGLTNFQKLKLETS